MERIDPRQAITELQLVPPYFADKSENAGGMEMHTSAGRWSWHPSIELWIT